jgi:hypothetical protein
VPPETLVCNQLQCPPARSAHDVSYVQTGVLHRGRLWPRHSQLRLFVTFKAQEALAQVGNRGLNVAAACYGSDGKKAVSIMAKKIRNQAEVTPAAASQPAFCGGPAAACTMMRCSVWPCGAATAGCQTAPRPV